MICCCSPNNLKAYDVLWRELIDEWRIVSYEVEYINRQQGLHCIDCKSNLRSMSLAKAIKKYFGYTRFFKNFLHKR